MINTKSNNKNTNKNKENLFVSLKNKREFQFEFETEAERLLMVLCEFDSTFDNYEPFEFRTVSVNSWSELESDRGLILITDGRRHDFIMLSDRLDANHELAYDVSVIIQQSEPNPIRMVVCPPHKLENNLQLENINFLYESALLPPDREVYAAIKEYLDFVSGVSIKQLKNHVKNETAIYQLLFHHALRADLETAALGDDTIVYASPIIKSIIESL